MTGDLGRAGRGAGALAWTFVAGADEMREALTWAFVAGKLSGDDEWRSPVGGCGRREPGVEQERVDAYLALLGVERPKALDADVLADLQRRHLRAVPFENLDIHLGRRIVLDEDALVAKLVDQRRGGFCYELNGAFAALLRALGFEVALLQARVVTKDGELGIPYDHLALRVSLDGEDWLVDVGFGRFALEPLRLAETGEQEDPYGAFRVAVREDGDIDVFGDGAPQYRLEPRARELADFAAGCWWHQTSPKSHFTRSPVCSRPTESGGRVTIADRLLIVSEAGERHEETLTDDAQLLAAYRDRFDIALDRVPDPGPAGLPA